MSMKDDSPERLAKHIAIVEKEPTLSESLLREGHWCRSTTCPRRRQAAEQEAANDQQSAGATPLIEIGEWCESTACPLV